MILNIFLLINILLHGHSIDVLQPKGLIASKERHLMMIAAVLSAVVVVPVFALTAYITLKYREGANKKAKYSPDLDGNRLLEFVWWGVPGVLILILSVITFQSSHQLDPFKSLDSNKKPLTIQVIALQWKWLFIYPQQGIATVNYAQIPVDTPVDFEITSDAPMNSFWIPQLGGQIYAMSGMSTHLHLMASEAGSYKGSSANISGKGFAGMKFNAVASSETEFDNWVQSVKGTFNPLDSYGYNQLAAPSENNRPANYSPAEPGLYNQVMSKYMGPGGHTHSGEEN